MTTRRKEITKNRLRLILFTILTGWVFIRSLSTFDVIYLVMKSDEICQANTQ